MYAFNSCQLPFEVKKSTQSDLINYSKGLCYLATRQGVYGVVVFSPSRQNIKNFISWYLWQVNEEDIHPFKLE